MDKPNCDSLVFAYNKKAMDFLRIENYKKALSFLNKAEEVLSSGQVQNLNQLLGITLNNFGCFYKRTGNPTLALNFLKKALEIENKDPVDVNNLAGTYLNMCAILSSIGEHQKALDHSLKAMNLLKTRVKDDENLLTTLIVAHHNAGIEYEMLMNNIEAKKVYSAGLKLTIEHYGEDHPLAISLKNSMKNLNINRKTISVSPIRTTPGSISMSRGSVLRSNKIPAHISGPNIISNLKSKTENVRFITGERLQPMHKKEDFRTREVKTRKKFDARTLIKELDGESSKYIKKQQKPGNEETEDTKRKTDVSDRIDNSKPNEKINTATQVEICDRRYFKIMRNNAAVIIQKHVRGFLARKRAESKKYEKQLKEAEEEMRKAQERLDGLKSQNRKRALSAKADNVVNGQKEFVNGQKEFVNGQKEFVPTVYKNKLERSVSRTSTVVSRRRSLLAPIPEEREDLNAKARIIQKNYRGWKERRRYKMVKKATVLIQKHIKRYQVRKLYLEIKDAIVFIQRTWRKLAKKWKKLGII